MTLRWCLQHYRLVPVKNSPSSMLLVAVLRCPKNHRNGPPELVVLGMGMPFTRTNSCRPKRSQGFRSGEAMAAARHASPFRLHLRRPIFTCHEMGSYLLHTQAAVWRRNFDAPIHGGAQSNQVAGRAGQILMELAVQKRRRLAASVR